ncbi:MAG: hypothetical protein DRO52_05425 [Candidatus Hecatellales archaeon]|nr:MAG: hypothetical protein DRO52_05425 [Candidatus Hecatellales archaeon]
MAGTAFEELCMLCETLAKTPSRNAKIELAARFLSKLNSPSEVSDAVRLIIGEASKDFTLNLGYSHLLKALTNITGVGEKGFLAEFGETGDLGETVRRLLEKGRRGVQQALVFRRPTIGEVAGVLREIAEISGKGAMAKKLRILESYLKRLTPLEAKYFTKNLVGEIRHGFGEGLMEEALASAFQASPEAVRNAHMVVGSLGRVGEILKEQGAGSLQSFTVKPLTPIRPMLAEPAQTLREALEEHHGRTLLEYKLDGARVQIHKHHSQIKIFSRRLTEVTKSLPEIVELAETFRGEDFVVDGEVVAVDQSGRVMPFQEVMKRYRRIIGVEEALSRIPTRIFLFDIVYLNGEPLLKKPLTERRQLLEKVAPYEFLTPQVEASNLEEAEAFFEEALKAGCEGVMAKRPSSPYSPGRRGKHWLKIKRQPEVLDLVIVAAQYGYGYRYRWLSDYYLAALNGGGGGGRPETLPDYIEALHGWRFRVVGKTFKGLTNAEIEALTERLKGLALETVGRTVIVRPEIVVEVGFSNIQPSPQYSCGYALRFARILRIRDDKKPEEADSLDRVKQLASKKLEG